MGHFTYAAVLVGCLAITLPLEFLIGARVYRQPGRWALAVLPIATCFVLSDAAAHSRGWWNFASRYTLDLPRPLGLPVEEWLFFVVIPTCGLLTLEAVRTLRPAWFADG